MLAPNPSPREGENLKNGLIGTFNGYRIHGKSYDPEGNEINEAHEEDCFCCRKNLLHSQEK